MTNQDVLEILRKIDNGYKPTDPILEFYEESEYDYALSEAKLSIIRKGVKVNDSQFEYTIGGNTLSIDMYHLIYGKVQGLLLQKKKYLKLLRSNSKKEYHFVEAKGNTDCNSFIKTL